MAANPKDDRERLTAFLSARFGSACRATAVERLSGGWSRTTLLARLDPSGDLPAEVILRAETQGGLLDTPLGTEFAVLRALGGSGVPVPRVFAFEPDREVIGMPFIVMERVDGFAPSLWRSEDRRRLEEPGLRKALEGQIVETLARIHALDWRGRGLEALAVPPPGPGYAAREVGFWERIWREAKLEPAPIVEEALVWMKAHLPACEEAVLVDGDYRIGNMLIGDRGIHAVLDWELATLGDPMRDLGYTTLEYIGGKFLEPGRFLCNGVMETDAFVEAYERRTGRVVSPERLLFWQVFGAFSLIAIMATGVREFARGNNSDLRMAWGRFGGFALTDDIARMLEF